MARFRFFIPILATCIAAGFVFFYDSTGQVPADTVKIEELQIKEDQIKVKPIYEDQKEEVQADKSQPDSIQTRAGLVTFVEGTLKKKAETASNWIIALKDTTVVSGEKVRTMVDSKAEIQLHALDILRMAPRTTIDIVKLYEETKSRKDHTEIEVEEGDIWAMVGNVETGAEFNLNTPVVGAAITGTVFRVSVSEDSSTQLKVYKGEVHLTNAPENKNLIPELVPITDRKKIRGPRKVSGPQQVTLSEWLYIVKDMQSIKISKKGNVLDSGSFSNEDKDEQSEWVKWNKARDIQRTMK